jgi:hypothetical protein
MKLISHKMLPEQEEQKKALHPWTLKRQSNAVSNGVSIFENSCPPLFFCNCLVDVHVVEGTGFIQLERRGLHNNNSHVGNMMVARNHEQLDHFYASDEEYDSEDEDYSEDEDDSRDGADSENDGDDPMLFLRKTVCNPLRFFIDLSERV